MKLLRFLLLPCGCFVLTWAAAHLLRTFAAVGDDAPPRPSSPATALFSVKKNTPPGTVGDRLRGLRETFAKAPPGEWSALWREFAEKASRADFEKLAKESKKGLSRLAEEELAVRSGRAAGSPGAFAALADHDPEAAWRQVRVMGQSAATAAVLRVLASRDPEDALRRWREMPVRPAPRLPTADERLSLGRTGVSHTALGSLFASWARRDPAGAEEAVSSLPLRFQQDARNEIALTWSWHDGPAALRYVSGLAAESGDGLQRRWIGPVLLSAISRWPSETAAVLALDPLLKTGTGEWGVPRAVPALWYLADPDGYMGWLNESGKNGAELFYSKAILRNPAAAARLLRAFPPGEETNAGQIISGIAQHDPAAGLDLADEFQVRPAVEAALRQSRAISNPAAACREWLAALRDHGADSALETLGWTPQTARSISDFAKSRLTEEARELASLLPPPAPPAERQPSAAPDPDSWSGGRRSEFVLDPASAASTLLESGRPIQGWDAWNVMSLWAPLDFPAARDWLTRLPEGEVRHRGEAALASSMASDRPGEALALLSSLPESTHKDTEKTWKESIQRLALTGGDWRQWISRMPAQSMNHGAENPEKALSAEAALLANLRQSP